VDAFAEHFHLPLGNDEELAQVFFTAWGFKAAGGPFSKEGDVTVVIKVRYGLKYTHHLCCCLSRFLVVFVASDLPWKLSHRPIRRSTRNTTVSVRLFSGLHDLTVGCAPSSVAAPRKFLPPAHRVFAIRLLFAILFRFLFTL